MSLSDDTIAALREAAYETHGQMADALAEYQDRIALLNASADVIDALRLMAEMHLSVQQLAEFATGTAKILRDALSHAMHSTGCPAVLIDGYKITTHDGAERVEIVDMSKLPHNLTMQPPRVADRETIGTMLRRGMDVPGAQLVKSAPGIRFNRR